MSKQFYIAVNGQQTGPFTYDELKTKYIRKDTLIWTDEIESWTEAGKIDLFKEIINPFFLITNPVKNITSKSVESGGNVVFDEVGFIVTRKGMCWGQSPSPTIDDNYSFEGEENGEFECMIAGLKSRTTYYMRAYAIDDLQMEEPVYGNEVCFTTKIATPPPIPRGVLKTESLEIADMDFPYPMNHIDAYMEIAGLGHRWRLPNNEELKEIYRLHKQVLFNNPEKFYWSSSWSPNGLGSVGENAQYIINPSTGELIKCTRLDMHYLLLVRTCRVI